MLLIIEPGSESTQEQGNDGKTHPLSATKSARQSNSQAASEQQLKTSAAAPRYQLPAMTPAHKAGKSTNIAPPPRIKAITPSTPIEHILASPERTKKPAPKIIQPETKGTSAVATTSSRIFFVQVGAYHQRSSAQTLAASLMQKGWNSMVASKGSDLYVVRVGPVSTRGAADQLRKKLASKAKLKGFIIGPGS
ncbi:MAG: SPOR domain-containing protein [Mariprofundaceae bacterium]|nr:SPOR domain-containing protein [Mariprofundaceae bacterium]